MPALRMLAGRGLAWALAAGLAGCALHKQPPLQTTPTFEAKPTVAKPPPGPLVVGPAVTAQRVASGPVPPSEAPVSAGPVGVPPLPAGAPTETLSLEQVSLPSFINEVFSKALKLNVQIDQAVATRTDLVTLRTGGPLPPRELFDMSVKVLSGYGVAVAWDGTVLRVTTDQALLTQMPAVIRSRALPEVPAALRPIFQIVDLHEVSNNDMMIALTNTYGSKVKLSVAPKANAILIFGLPNDVRDVVEAARVLDHARLAGHGSLRVSPVYWTARGLAEKVVQLLRAEGYDAAENATPTQTNAVMVLPIEANNSIVALAADPKILAHIERWVADLDQPGQADPAHNIFIYSVQNTTAASLGRVIQGVLGGTTTGGVSAPAAAQLEAAGRTQAPPTTTTALPTAGSPTTGTTGAASLPTAPTLPPRQTEPLEGPLTTPTATGPQGSGPAPLRLVVDSARNALVFVGTAQDFSRIRPLLEALDKAPREALIEVTVVEVDLNDSANLGVEWTLVTPLLNGAQQKLGTGANVLGAAASAAGAAGGTSSTAGLPIGNTGFNYTILNSLGDMRLLLNAFAQNTHISVLSTPRILAESGGQASISVGEQVPTITSQGTTNVIQSQGTSGILQSIEYQQTGVVLNVSPVVHSGNRIDLNVSQGVSTDQGNCVTGISSPCIQNRNVATQLTLSDGQTVVIGGLISDTRTQNDSGVPYLKDIPGLGVFFRNESPSRQRTELLIFITPYVISNDTDAANITQQFEDQMKSWPVPNSNLHR